MYTLIIEPRFAETDALGHINNTALPVWFETGRAPIFKHFVPSMKTEDWNLILAKIEVEYIREIFYSNEVEIRTYVEGIGNSSFVVYQEAWQTQKLAAKGRATMVHLDLALKKSKPIPDEIRKTLSEHLLESA